MKVSGFRKNGEDGNGEGWETEADFTMRVAGIMRIYFSVLKIVPVRGPLRSQFQLPRYWTWFARMLGERQLLESAVSAQVMHSKCFMTLLSLLRLDGC
jgi:nucleoporin GLE1